ncbi:MAG: LysE family transporter [Kiritimatiellae bacterium]|nr:LysE family transporter [Kiritimatiellia bacterium]
MYQLFFLFWSAFVVGLSGAMMPGPVLTATISEVLKRGWKAGPLIVLGHAILEIVVLLAVVLGLGAWITRDTVMGALGVAGGLILIAMGIQMAVTARAATQQALSAEPDPKTAVRGPVWVGMLTSASNPYFLLWWATVGLNFAAIALKNGWAGLASFYTGHILSDLAWYTLVAVAVASGRRICPPRVYQAVIATCGVVLMGLGAYFLATGAGRWMV